MLEVKNLVRRYTPKKGEPVLALNDVSLRFPDHGLIFILGKSGSGKSTLLNVMGGLDRADEGEIIIKGKSSSDFSQSDFDSYRNTYLGFIFQEYNILDEFNVGQNIALAIQLQGKKASSEDIKKILEDVDLVGYGNRKTNELSGGQKQRVAIARALVKNPEIIFADEPTGALDSKTGLAVFDTLKKLSKNKLVVVVSHDREFAEMFGDRVIELADGVVISDIEKTKVAGEVKTEGISIIDGTILRIKKDYVLTNQDVILIRDYLNKTNSERLISISDHVNENIRHITRIDELGNKESFSKTNEDKIVNKPGQFNSIPSKLSLRNCFKIGCSSLKVKPFRLLITILLSIVAFGMFGLADTMGSYEKVEATIVSMNDSNIEALSLEKNYVVQEGDRSYNYTSTATDADIASIKDKYNLDVTGVFSVGRSWNNMISFVNNFKQYPSSNDAFHVSSTPGLFLSNPEQINTLGFDIIAGTYPENINEVAITKHIYDSFIQYGYRNYQSSTDNSVDASNITPDSLIGKTIILDNKEFTITAIIDTKFDTTSYKLLDNISSDNLGVYMMMNQYEAAYKYGYHGLFYTNELTINYYKNKNQLQVNGGISFYSENRGDYSSFSTVSKYSSNIDEKYNTVVLKTGKNSLSTNETVMSLTTLKSLLQNAGEFYDSFDSIKITDDPLLKDFHDTHGNEISLQFLITRLNPSDFRKSYIEETYSEAISNGFDPYEWFKEQHNTDYAAERDDNASKSLYEEYVDSLGYNRNKYTSDSLYEYGQTKMKAIYDKYLDQIIGLLPETKVNIDVNNPYGSERFQLLNESFTFIGLDISEDHVCYLEDKIVEQVTFGEGYYSYLLTPMPESSDLLRKIIVDTYSADTTTEKIVYTMENEIMPAFDNVNGMIESMASVFLWVGVGFAVFASLMLFNFITISISYKKREIGILRAVGARSKDVFNIFLAESFVITMISYTFAILTTFAVSIYLNTTLRNEYNLVITLLSPGIRQVGLVLGTCLLVAIISTLLPVYNIAMKRPIDAIQNR